MGKTKNNKIGIFSDLHLGIGQDSDLWHGIAMNFAKKASAFYEKNEIADIVFCGDFFHNRTEVSVKTIHKITEFLEYFKNFNLHVIVGNHDSFYKDHGSVNSIAFLRNQKNVITFAETHPKKVKFKDKTGFLVPWGVDIKDIPKCDILFGHFEINSFYYNQVKQCSGHVEPTNILKKAPYVISGHFHKKDHRVYKEGEILYLGSPYQHTFGDIDDERGFYVFDLDDMKYDFIVNDEAPVHKKIKLSDIIEKKLDAAEIRKIVTGNHVNFLIDNDLDQVKLNVLLTKIKSIGPATFRLEYNIPNKVSDTDDAQDDDSIFEIEKTTEEFLEKTDFKYKKETLEIVKSLYEKYS